MMIPIPSLPKAGRLAFAVVLAALLSACGGGSSPPPADPMAQFTRQELDWQVCDPTVVLVVADSLLALGERARCALVRAPLDYANPALGELQVALLRVAAEDPSRRLGALLLNPGGPGGDGLLLAPLFGKLWTDANPADATGRLLKDMSSRYDLIGFSPRGVGASSTLTCVSSELREVENSLVFDRSPLNLANALHNARLQAQACAKNPLTKHIHTDATARDMDLVRGLLGDAKLNFFGASYGTWLGAWYASLFPERVGRMLLDSSMNVAGTYDDAFLLQEMGRQRMLDEVLLPYAARYPGRFNLGNDPAQLRSDLLALSPALKEVMVANIEFNSTWDVDRNVLRMTAAIGLQALRLRWPSASENDMHSAIDAHAFTPAGPQNLVAAELAHQFTRTLFTVPVRAPNITMPSSAVNLSVICNDLRTGLDEQQWIDAGTDYAMRYPLTGGQATRSPCLYWAPPVIARPALAMAGGAGPLLMLQSRFDAETPVEGAYASLAALPNARMIVVENEYRHGVFPYDEPCVDGAVADYFVNGTVPPRLSSCAGRPLPADAAAAAAAASSRLRRAAPAAGIYKNQAEAEVLMRSIHERTGRTIRGF